MSRRWIYLKRFFNKILMKGLDDCWDWQGGINKDGYGMVSYLGEMTLAHRVAWILHHWKYVPEGMCVLHKCDRRQCVNPKHLYLGTHAENMKDMVEKGRSVHRHGEDNPNCKLNKEKVREIKQLQARGVSRHRIAKKYEISLSTVDRIKYGLSWKDV